MMSVEKEIATPCGLAMSRQGRQPFSNAKSACKNLKV